MVLSWSRHEFTEIHGMQLTINVVERRVHLVGPAASKVFEGGGPRNEQWLILYTELALRRTSQENESSYLDAEQLKILGRWSLKRVGSVGKEMARHLEELKRAGLGNAIEHKGKTRRWRLGLLPKEIVFLSSREACEVWLRDRNFDYLGGLGRIPGDIVPWLREMTWALIRFQQGRLPEARAHVKGAEQAAAASALLGAITELVELRLLARRGEYPEIGPGLERCEGGLGEALRVRAELARALEPDPGYEEEKLEELRRLLLRLETLPDVNGLGGAHNALAVRLRRQGKLDLAARSLRYAAALLIATFDLPTLQAAVFNLGHTLHEAATTRAQLEEALGVVSLDREIYRELGLGGDSAQAEIVAGLICLKLERIAEAEKWQATGREAAERIESEYNLAGVRLLRARILWMKRLSSPEVDTKYRAEILGEFRAVEALVQSAGFTGEDIRREAGIFRAGGRPPWLLNKPVETGR